MEDISFKPADVGLKPDSEHCTITDTTPHSWAFDDNKKFDSIIYHLSITLHYIV
jgi:hypothetical protein